MITFTPFFFSRTKTKFGVKSPHLSADICLRSTFLPLSPLSITERPCIPRPRCFPWPPCFEKFLTWLHVTSAAVLLFLSLSAVDRGLTGNCHCDECQTLRFGQALTFASFGVHKLPTNGQKVYQHKKQLLISQILKFEFLCWTLALAKLQLRLFLLCFIVLLSDSSCYNKSFYFLLYISCS